MRSMKVMLWFAAALLTTAGIAGAQSTTGTISGRVTDAQALSVPGVTINAESPNLQGIRTAVTSDNGDYIITLLPPGTYKVSFELSGFERQERTVNLAPTQVLPLDVTMGPAAVSETVEVVARAADVLTQTAQVATNFNQNLIQTLPTNRDVRSIMLLAPAVHSTGPAGNFSIAGSASFENLFMVNGVTVNENLRGQPSDLVIEDAIQETTIAAAGVSAEYGRFAGGVVNVITKSGGNLFTGSYRETLTNDDWRALVPKREGDAFANDSKADDVVPTHEYTFGGPLMRDRLWFFTAGRLQNLKANRQLVVTNIPYTFTNPTRRYEGKVTYALATDHRFQSAFTKLTNQQLNNTFNPNASMDLNSLEDRKVPEDLFTLNYSGVLSPTLFVEARYSQRNLTFEGSGAKFTDRLKGTLLVDPSGRRYWSATFCGVCTPEQRDNQDIFVKGTYFLSTSSLGTHSVVLGYDNFSDKRFANNHQSGSDYRILNATAIIPAGTTNIFPQFRSGVSVIQWNPIFIESQGNNFRTHSLFLNDNWRVSSRVTANLGVRWDKNHGENGAGELVAKNSAFSPRLGVVLDPTGEGRWSVTGSAAKYTAGILNSIADVTSPAGNSDQYQFVYRGPTINGDPNGPLVSPENALQQLFAWFDANGGATLPLAGSPSVRGVSPRILDSLKPPSTWEYAAGVTRQFGNRGAIRADYVYRNYQDFYVARVDTTTGRATDTRSFAPPAVQGRQYDLQVIENDEGAFKRRYSGVTLQGTYRPGTRINVGGNYTISRAWGNIEGENFVSGPLVDSPLQYPEYRQESWNYPEGDLAVDQRHRARLWLNYGVPRVEGLTLSFIQALESGIPHSASNQNGTANGVDPRPYVRNPGYLTPIAGNQTTYFYSARDAFRLEGQKRTDFAANYEYGIGVGGRTINLFIQAQVINLFNQFQLCGCGGNLTTFSAGGNVQNQTVDVSVRTSVTTPATYQPFNPFTTTPVEGVNWAKSPTFGHALNRFAYTTPRTFRMTFGVRF